MNLSRSLAPAHRTAHVTIVLSLASFVLAGCQTTIGPPRVGVPESPGGLPLVPGSRTDRVAVCRPHAALRYTLN